MWTFEHIFEQHLAGLLLVNTHRHGRASRPAPVVVSENVLSSLALLHAHPADLCSHSVTVVGMHNANVIGTHK